MDLFSISNAEVAMRLTIAMTLGIIVGVERSRVGKRAGMRTYALVSLGSALFILMSGLVSAQMKGAFNFDPLRVASQLVVGIGFLGAGVIYVQHQKLTGLTTAAGLWVVAAIGASCGFGLYFISIFTTVLTLFIFEVLWYVEEKFVKQANDEDPESTKREHVHQHLDTEND